MDRINEIKAKRDEIAKYYDVKLPKLGCKPQQIAHGEIHGRYFYMLTCNNRNQLFITCRVCLQPLAHIMY